MAVMAWPARSGDCYETSGRAMAPDDSGSALGAALAATIAGTRPDARSLWMAAAFNLATRLWPRTGL